MKDRKFKGFLIGTILLIVGYVLTHLLKIESGLFKTFIYGLLGLATIYDGSNILTKKILNGGKK